MLITAARIRTKKRAPARLFGFPGCSGTTVKGGDAPCSRARSASPVNSSHIQKWSCTQRHLTRAMGPRGGQTGADAAGRSAVRARDRDFQGTLEDE